ncbi:serpin family protein [Nonomuraea aridisoli]|uniref:Serpin domain-containing protein n=1 Tax=Nonomuraea aridisoli TaxID=2070368 RepID=A0A2W2EUD5_9ACTN|nr:serpin family protein [Nonomuraea aridisoli]PZG17170.1 hypothetical protein C1J01_18740 [Nonomuraea aridisoli]
MSVAQVRATEPGDRLDVTVPRFTVSSTHDLLRLPEVFGLATVSDTSCGHFPGISPEPLAVGQATQAAVAVFSATGFESASVTAFDAVGGGAPPREPYRIRRVRAVFGRPFGFLTVERRSRMILTAGWVADPEAGAPVAR